MWVCVCVGNCEKKTTTLPCDWRAPITGRRITSTTPLDMTELIWQAWSGRVGPGRGPGWGGPTATREEWIRTSTTATDDEVDDNNNWWRLILDVGGLRGPIAHRDDVDLHDDVARPYNDDMTSRNHVMYERVPCSSSARLICLCYLRYYFRVEVWWAGCYSCASYAVRYVKILSVDTVKY